MHPLSLPLSWSTVWLVQRRRRGRIGEMKELMVGSHLSEREREKGHGLLLRYWAMVGPCGKGKKGRGSGLRCGPNGEGKGEEARCPFSVSFPFLFSFFSYLAILKWFECKFKCSLNLVMPP